ncbi:MAG: aconitase family protein, partial [Anaerolineae bacterium]
MGQTFVEKVLARKAGLDQVMPGQIVTVRPDKLLTHDNTADISRKFRRIGVDRVADPSINVIVLDHVVPAANETYATNHQIIREFVAAQGISAFYDIGEGICHQVLPEKGHAWPGAVIVGSDSHTTTHGAFGAFSAGIGRTEAAAVMATGQIWLRVPESLRIVVDGALQERVMAKDLILHIIGDLRADGANYCSVEFAGNAVRAMSVASRMVLTNMAAEMGAKNGVVEPDEKTEAWLAGRVDHGRIAEDEAVYADPDATYARV